MSGAKKKYAELSDELAAIMQRIDSIEDIDEMVELHEQANKIISTMQKRLEEAKMKITTIENTTE